MVSAGMPDRALTERILEVADEAGYRAALVDATDGSVTAWPRFARIVRAAACGLTRRGLAEGDTAGVFVQDAVSAAIAVNAIRAAGAVACLVRSDADPADVAGQVIAFGAAAGTTPFSSLLESGRPGQPDVYAAAEPGLVDLPSVVEESGRPEGNGLADQHDLADSGGPDLGGELTYRDVVVAGPPCGDGRAYTSLLDLTLLTGATLVAAPVTLVTAAMRVYKGIAAIVPRGTHVPGVPPSRVFPVA